MRIGAAALAKGEECLRMLDQKEIQNLYDEKFELDFHSFQLLNNNDRRRTGIKGNGYLKNTIDNIFEFKLYPSRDISKKLELDYSKLVEDCKDKDGLFYFQAIDFKGRKWTFKTFSVSRSLYQWSKQGFARLIEGNTKEIRFIEKWPYHKKDDFIKIILFDQKKIPFTENEKIDKRVSNKKISTSYRAIAKHVKGSFKIDGKQIEERTYLNLYKAGAICNQEFHIRVVESLQFILGQEINPAITISKIGNTMTNIISSNGRDETSQIEPPIQFDKYPSKDNSSIWLLFIKYLEYIAEFEKKVFHPLGAQINGVIGSGNSFLETQFLVISVAIEGILGKLYKDFAERDNKFKDQIDDLVEYLKEWDKNGEILKRAIKPVQNMKDSRAKDKLYELEAMKVITKKHISSWDRLRNTSAHGLINLSGQSKSKFENYRKNYYCVLELFYRLIFNKIGYDGEFTKYCEEEN